MKEHTHNFMIFQLSGMDCAFPLEAVREVVPMAQLSTPLGMPSGLAGFLNLRGTAIPILRLDRLFELPEQEPGLHTPMIVLRGVEAPIGILAKFVRGIVQVPASRFLPIPGDRTLHGCVTGAMQMDDDLIYLLSPAALLQANEARLLADYCAMTEARLLHLAETI